METPNYIKSLVTPTTKQPQGRKVWSIDLQQVWLPFFTATNTMGDTAIPMTQSVVRYAWAMIRLVKSVSVKLVALLSGSLKR